MSAVIADARLKDALIAERRASGTDRWDEVWEGVYVLMPLPNDEHQGLVGDLTAILKQCVEWTGLGLVRPGVNISDRVVDWMQNYRCPDVVVFLKETSAENHEAFWYGGPDFAIEVVSPGDRSREKLEFYATVGTRELLIIDREPWSLELFRLQEDRLQSVGRSSLNDEAELASELVPLSFRLRAGEGGRPQIEVARQDDSQVWTL
jgi:Uma2 family endonuclease